MISRLHPTSPTFFMILTRYPSSVLLLLYSPYVHWHVSGTSQWDNNNVSSDKPASVAEESKEGVVCVCQGLVRRKRS